MIQIGVIGPIDTVERVMSVTKEFQDDVTFQPFIYENFDEVEEIIKENRMEYDYWYFSGNLTYSYITGNKLIPKEKAGYPELYGSSFFETLLEAQIDGDTLYKNFSIDTVKNEEIEKILSFYGLDSFTYYNSPVKGYEYISELVEFHRKHYETGQTEIAITSLRKVYLLLKELGIPAYRVTPSYLAIKFSLQILMERVQTNYYKRTQLAVIGFKFVFHSSAEDEFYYSFKLKYKELELRRALLYIAEKVNGSFMQLGDGLFFVFTTRGELETQSESNLFSVMEEMAQADINLIISIGYGDTVSLAEQHVRYGFRNLKQDEQSIIIIEDDLSITVKKTTNQTFSYNPIQLGEAWKEKIQNVSPGILSKITSYVQKYGRNEFTTRDVANWIQSTERNGRRIVMEMKKAGIIEQCGEIQSGIRGRPRRVFRFMDS